MKTENFKLKTDYGYTLIEMMVAVSIFVIVAMGSISVLISINSANKKAQTMRAVIDNLNYAMENMARSLRVGSNYVCGETENSSASPIDCGLNGNTAISFKDFDGNWIIYRFNELGGRNQIEKYMKNTQGQVVQNYLPITPYIDDPKGGFQPLTIDYMKFYVSGSQSGDNMQPRVVILVGGTARYNDKIDTKFQIETSVSQRKIDS